MPQQQQTGHSSTALLVLTEAMRGVQFGDGRFLPFPVGEWTAAVSRFARTAVEGGTFRQAFVGGSVELRSPGPSPDVVGDPRVMWLRRLQRTTIATFVGTTRVSVGTVLVREGAHFQVLRLACHVDQWGDAPREAWIPVTIQTAGFSGDGWISVGATGPMSVLICLSRNAPSITELASATISAEGILASVSELRLEQQWDSRE